jgi:peptide/nickel transport system permease protein
VGARRQVDAAGPILVVCLSYQAFVVAVALIGPVIAPIDPNLIVPTERLLPPAATHPLGTDDLGRDVLSRLIAGARVSLPVGATVMLISVGLGSVLGLVSGWYERFDAVIMRILDAVLAVPRLLVAIALLMILGPGLMSIVIALTFSSVPRVARVMRSSVLVIRRQPFIEASRALGQTDVGILRDRVLPHALPSLIPQASFIVATAIAAEAALAFIGARGSTDGTSWGSLLRDGQRLLAGAWWVALAPGAALFLTILALNISGEALRDRLDPRAVRIGAGPRSGRTTL